MWVTFNPSAMYRQGCALEAHSHTWQRTFAFVRPGNIRFCTWTYILGTPYFKGLEILGIQPLFLEHSFDPRNVCLGCNNL